MRTNGHAAEWQVSTATPSLHVSFGEAAALPSFTPRLVLQLLLPTLLFAALVCSATAVRYYNHAGFISDMPVESDARQRWAQAGMAYVRRAGIMLCCAAADARFCERRLTWRPANAPLLGRSKSSVADFL